MKLNQKGFVVEGVLVVSLLVGMVLLFVPNPVSNAVGVGVRPNKTVQTASSVQTVDFLKKDFTGQPVAEEDGSYLTRTTIAQKTSDVDSQQHVTIWQSFLALPRLFLIIVVLAILGFPPAVTFIARLKKAVFSWQEKHQELESETQKIVLSVDKALDTMDASIEAAQAAAEASTEPSVKATQTAIATALIMAKKKFLVAMKREQDKSTGLVVQKLRQTSPS